MIKHGPDEWYSPPILTEASRLIMGGIDLDPFSSKEANQFIKAKKFYSKLSNALTQHWEGRVYLNPPFSIRKTEEIINKAMMHYSQGHITAMVWVMPQWCSCPSLLHSKSKADAYQRIGSKIGFVSPNTEVYKESIDMMYFGNNSKFAAEVFKSVNDWAALKDSLN